MQFIYNLFIFIYQYSIRISAFFGNEKARKWLSGRKDIFNNLSSSIGKDDKIIWFHCASLGEFEQGRPLIEALRKQYADYKILLTFFSPSGYEIRKNYKQADYVFYLPIDTTKNARRFVEIVRPRAVFFIKYEFWFNYINELYTRKIPFFMVSTIFRPSQHFFGFWGFWFRKQLRKITFLFVQDENSLELLENIKIYHADIIGDTRFDRVVALAEEEKEFPLIKHFGKDKPILVAGSTWPADEDKLLKLIDQLEIDLKLIIAPHHVDSEHIEQIKKKFSKYEPILYSNADDGIGYLSYLYRYATITYIGGGFGIGIHNLLEAATYGKPVIFGTNHSRFNEAIELKKNGGGFAISNSEELISLCRVFLTDNKKHEISAQAAKNYVINNAGATFRVIDKAKEYLTDK